MKNDIILVNENNKKIGEGEKMDVHEKGLLHRAFSIFIFNNKNELMLQKRAATKYHSPNLWSNTCCSHPKPSEKTKDGAERRIEEEMGFKCELEELLSFTYKVGFSNGLVENEYDHIFMGEHKDKPRLNLEEASDWKWVDLEDLEKDMHKNPENYTHWLKLCLNKLITAVSSD
ncbi:MAG: isopentenyl-diphosphate Delta-isomerase [Parcubacteria group bacterium]|nr:isopentenyl-diphosphate Delta-isomerase [Parcubacteria group bacterium]